jgi:hypothetical protein
MRLAGLVFAIMLICTMVPGLASAQNRGSVELGVDGRIGVSIIDAQDSFFEPDNLTTVAIPNQSLRVGAFVSNTVQVGPSLSLVVLSQGGESLLALDLGLDVTYNFRSDRSGPIPFLQGGVAFSTLSNGGSHTQFRLGGSGGIKLPAGDQFAVRLEAGVNRAFETDDMFGMWNIFGGFGFSFFTR